MKHTLLLLNLLFLFPLSFVYSISVQSILNSQIHAVGKVDVKQKENRIFLKTSFSSPAIQNPQEIQQIKGLVIYRIDLVFTSYKNSKSFNQRELNKKRLLALQTLYPEVFKNNLIAWRMVAQKEPANSEAAKGLFHGFIINYRPVASKDLTEKEITYIKDLLAGKRPSWELLPSDKVPEVEVEDELVSDSLSSYVSETPGFSQMVPPSFKGGKDSLESFLKRYYAYSGGGSVNVRFVVTKTGAIKNVIALDKTNNGSDLEAVRLVQSMPAWNPGNVKGKAVDYSFTLPLMLSKKGTSVYRELWSSIFMYTEALKKGSDYLNTTYIDSTVINVFERNRNWQKMLIVCDVTSSMSPYFAQLLLWFKASLVSKVSKSEYFAFFNDGDNIVDSKKKLGVTGGIYHGKATSFEEVQNLAFKAMQNGNGGDTPENNMEATIVALNQCPTCEDVVMIADNYAIPRDLTLLTMVNMPIHVIVCGAREFVNVAYLNLALKTKGTVHTIDQDFNSLIDIKEGGQITIGKETYQIKNGLFEEIPNVN